MNVIKKYTKNRIIFVQCWKTIQMNKEKSLFSFYFSIVEKTACIQKRFFHPDKMIYDIRICIM